MSEDTKALTAKDAFKMWWNALTLQGDPAHRYNLTTEAFNAGWNFALEAANQCVQDARFGKSDNDLRCIASSIRYLKEPIK